MQCPRQVNLTSPKRMTWLVPLLFTTFQSLVVAHDALCVAVASGHGPAGLVPCPTSAPGTTPSATVVSVGTVNSDQPPQLLPGTGGITTLSVHSQQGSSITEYLRVSVVGGTTYTTTIPPSLETFTIHGTVVTTTLKPQTVTRISGGTSVSTWLPVPSVSGTGPGSTLTTVRSIGKNSVTTKSNGHTFTSNPLTTSGSTRFIPITVLHVTGTSGAVKGQTTDITFVSASTSISGKINGHPTSYPGGGWQCTGPLCRPHCLFPLIPLLCQDDSGGGGGGFPPPPNGEPVPGPPGSGNLPSPPPNGEAPPGPPGSGNDNGNQNSNKPTTNPPTSAPTRSLTSNSPCTKTATVTHCIETVSSFSNAGMTAFSTTIVVSYCPFLLVHFDIVLLLKTWLTSALRCLAQWYRVVTPVPTL